MTENQAQTHKYACLTKFAIPVCDRQCQSRTRKKLLNILSQFTLEHAESREKNACHCKIPDVTCSAICLCGCIFAVVRKA